MEVASSERASAISNEPVSRLAMPLSVVDAAFSKLYEGKIFITGVLMLEREVTMDEVRKWVAREVVEKYPRFRAVLDRSTWIPRFIELDPHEVDLRQHIIQEVLPDSSDESERHSALQQRVSMLVNEAPDMHKDWKLPLWHMHLLKNCPPPAGSKIISRSTVIFSIHHSISDGLGLTQLMLDMGRNNFHDVKNALFPKRVDPPPKNTQRPSLISYLLSTILRWISFLSSLVALLFMGRDWKTSLKPRGRLATKREVVWNAHPIPLDRLRMIAKRLGYTVNDVVLAAIAGSLRSYVQAEYRGKELPDRLFIRGLMPISVRPEEAELALGNYLTGVFLDLPVGLDDGIARLRVINERMSALKSSIFPIVGQFMAYLLGVLPAKIGQMLVELFSGYTTMVLSNVPGPRAPIDFVCDVENIMFFIPPTGDIGLVLSVMSYCGKVNVGVTVDTGLNVNPHELLSGFLSEMESLEEAAAESL